MHSIKIREVERRDLDAVYEIEEVSFKDPYPPAFLKFLYEVDKKTFLIAEMDGVVVGYLIASVENEVGHIISIAIHPNVRKKNIGKMIIDKVLKLLKVRGAINVRLEVRKSNLEAQKFYEFVGFKHSNTVENYYGDEDAFTYSKEI